MQNAVRSIRVGLVLLSLQFALVLSSQIDQFDQSLPQQWELEGSSSSSSEDSTAARALVYDYGFRDQKRPQIVFFGDSITNFGFMSAGPDADKFKLGPDFKGWAVRLNETLQNQAALMNLAFKAGTNTRGFNQSMPLLFEQLKKVAPDVALVNIAFGANDAVLQ